MRSLEERLGVVDGTLVPLYYRPYWYAEAYFDRKSNYSLNIQV